MYRLLSFLCLSLFVIPFSLESTYAQESVILPDGLHHGDEIILIADTANIYAYPDTSSSVVHIAIKGYVDQLGPQTTSPDGWAYLSKSVGFIQLDEIVLAKRTDTLQAQMLEEANQRIEAEPNNANAYIQRGVIYTYMNEVDAALADFSHAISLAPDDATAYMLRGRTHRQMNQLTNSIADFEQANALGDTSVDTLTGIGRAYASLDMNFEANPWLQQAVDTYPDAYHAWNTKANFYVYYETTASRLSDYDRATEINELGYYAYVNRALIYKENEEHELALEEYQRIIDIDPYHAGIYLSMGYFYRNHMQDPHKALEYAERALALDSEFAEAYALAATIYAYELGDRGKALENFEMAFQTNPTDITTWMEAYGFYSRLGEYEKALEYNDIVVSYQPIDSRVYRDRAQIYFAMGRYEEAYKSLDIYWDDYTDYYQGVGLIQLLRTFIALQEGDYITASEQLDIAFTVTNWWARDWSEKRGLRIYDSRVALLEQYYQKTIAAPNFPNSYLHVGHILVEFGHWEEALDYYRQYLSMVDDPDLAVFVETLASNIEGN